MTKPDGSVEAGSESLTKRRRGKWTAQQRRRIIADSRVAGATVQAVAERHGVRANLLSAWRQRDDRDATRRADLARVRRDRYAPICADHSYAVLDVRLDVPWSMNSIV